MNNKAILNVLNNLEVEEQNSGEDAYILVNQTPDTVTVLKDLGVSQDTISKYGDGETFCILALAFGEGYANFYHNGLVEWPEEAIELVGKYSFEKIGPRLRREFDRPHEFIGHTSNEIFQLGMQKAIDLAGIELPWDRLK
ncbi:hypothetical protein [Paenibacillus amylolyticus]|uniref:hypothetical protein n=1 Tax=Paenibacillus amylolyticus TaxID=1451 RepID=UPI000B8802FE|nr:hypothetical protein [Paenibacillus amylolyticus]